MPRIHAHFENMSLARKALEAILQLGNTKAHLDLTGVYDYEYSAEINIAGTESAPSLSALVARGGGYQLDPEKAPLIAAGTAISGLAHTRDSDLICTKLVANAGDEKKNEIENIIKENGGRIFPTFIE